MKNLRTIACFACLLFSLSLAAQQTDIPLNEPDQNKPELFKQKPNKVSIESQEIATLLTAQVGDPVILSLPSFHFEGNVIATVSKYQNTIQSVVIRSTNYEGATMTLSRSTDENGNVIYSGRIISMKHADLYELKKIDKEFALVKNKYNSVLVE